MIIKILGESNTPAYEVVKRLIEQRGHTISDGTHFVIDLAVAPLLTQILTLEEIKEPLIGTLIFHPSPLPYGRGAAAIKYAYTRKEPITAATWFWAAAGIDSGDICEQEIIKIDYSLRPRDFYYQEVVPAMCRTLERILKDIDRGIIRKIPQIERYATYDKITV